MKNTHWTEVLGNNVSAQGIVDRAAAADVPVELWVTNEINALNSIAPGEGYDEYDTSDAAMFAKQIVDDAEEV